MFVLIIFRDETSNRASSTNKDRIGSLSDVIQFNSNSLFLRHYIYIFQKRV